MNVVEHYETIRQPLGWLYWIKYVWACSGYAGGMGGTPICIHLVMLKYTKVTVNYILDTLRGKLI